MNEVTIVAVYTRVSTDKEDQANSLETQKHFFESKIKENENWQLYKIYTDEGVSGTSTEKRNAFNAMIHDAELGRFDLILTKEVSRFARNTVDVLNYTRELKKIGVGVYFLNDSINTLDNDGELRLSIMSSIAQEESRKTSERVKFGQHERMKQGVVFGRDMLGYDVRGGKLYLNDEGAEVVKKIFNKYTVEGKGTHVIARELTNEGILSLNPDGSVKNGHSWSAGTIIKILRNEKYVGDLCQHKTITTSCLTHKKKYNRGEQDFVYIRDHHPDIAIIDRDLWDRTQAELERRKMTDEQRQKYSNRYWASGKIFCGECGDSYIHNMLRRKDGSQYSTWKCFTNNHYGHKKVVKGKTIGCDSFVLNGQVLNVCMDYILSFILKDKEILIKRMKREIKAVLERRTPSGNKDKILQKISSFEDKITRLIDLKLDGQITSEEMKLAKEKYNKNIEVLKIQLDNIIREEENNQNEAARIEGIIAEIRKLLDFDISCARDELYKSVTNKIVVYNEKTLLVYLNCLPTPIKLKYHTHGKMDTYTVDITEFGLYDEAAQ